MEKTYVISCPICGASLNYIKDELSTVCGSCKNTVYREKRPQDINLNLKYAVVSDGSSFAQSAEFDKTNLGDYSSEDFTVIEPNKLDAITVSKIDGLVYELTVNYTGDMALDKNDLERREQIVDEILKLDNNNIYGRFLRDIVMTKKLKFNKVNEIFTRSDALIVQDYVLSFFPIDVGQDVDVIILIMPMINYIMHTDLTHEDKYYHILRSFKKNYPFQTIRPSIFENEGPERLNKIIEGYKSLLSALIHLNVPHKMTVDTAKILKDHFTGISNLEIIKLFINYIIQSNLLKEEKQEFIESFFANEIYPLSNFNECYAFLGFINSLGYERYTSSKLTQLAIQNCLPKSITFDGYAILNRFIKDSRIRFQETYCLYIRFSETLFFKQMLVQVLYSQKILDKDDMLLFIDCVAVFAKVSLNSEKKLSSMQLNQEVMNRLGLTTYSDTVKKYHWNKIKTLKKWSQLDKNELLLQILVEKRALLGDSHRESPKERDIGDRVVIDKRASMASTRKVVRVFQAIACCILSMLIFINFYQDMISEGNIAFIIFIGGLFYFLIGMVKSKQEGIESTIVIIVGLLVIAFFTGIANDDGGVTGFAIILFVLLQLPLYYVLGLLIFDPLYHAITSTNKLIHDILMTDERRERICFVDDKQSKKKKI